MKNNSLGDNFFYSIFFCEILDNQFELFVKPK